MIARDKGTPSLQGSATVIVQVTDRNDNAPKFVQEVFTFYVKENLLTNSPVGMVTVTDADEGENAELSFLLSMMKRKVERRAKRGSKKFSLLKIILEPFSPLHLLTANDVAHTHSACVLLMVENRHGLPPPPSPCLSLMKMTTRHPSHHLLMNHTPPATR